MQQGRSPNPLLPEYVFQRRKDLRSIASIGFGFFRARHQRAGCARGYAESFGYLVVSVLPPLAEFPAGNAIRWRYRSILPAETVPRRTEW